VALAGVTLSTPPIRRAAWPQANPPTAPQLVLHLSHLGDSVGTRSRACPGLSCARRRAFVRHRKTPCAVVVRSRRSLSARAAGSSGQPWTSYAPSATGEGPPRECGVPAAGCVARPGFSSAAGSQAAVAGAAAAASVRACRRTRSRVRSDMLFLAWCLRVSPHPPTPSPPAKP
jgi:hypothetical protein